MSSRAAAVMAWGLWVVWLVLSVLSVWLVPSVKLVDVPWLGVAGCATFGALILQRHPRNAMGWLLMGLAIFVALQFASEGLGERPELPGQVWGLWAASSLWYVWLAIQLIFIPLLAPTGSLPSRRWRFVLGLAVIGLLAAVIGSTFKSGPLNMDGRTENPLGAPGALGQGFVVLELVGDGLLLVASPLAIGSLVYRFRRSRGTERQQLKWFAYVAVLMFAGWALFMVSNGLPAPWSTAAVTVGWFVFLSCVGVLLPAAIAIAIFRHRLYDIDLVINRTLVYGALTAALLATYGVSVLVLRTLFTPVTGDSDLAVAGSTLAVAALFRPARARIQAVVDRRFYRHKYDAARTLDDFGSRLRHEVDLDAVGSDLRAVVEQTVQPAYVTLWIRP